MAQAVGTLSLITRTAELGFYRAINLKRRRQRTHHRLLAAGLCSCCSFPPRAASSFILLPSCQCNVQPMHTLCSYIPITCSFTILSSRRTRVPPPPPPPPKALPRAILPSSCLAPPRGHTELELAWKFCIFMVY